MDDVVQRLRDGLEAGAIDLADIMDAADEIERLRHGTAVADNCVAGNQPEIPCPRNGSISARETVPDPDSRTWETHFVNQPAPPCVETDGFSPGSRTGQINRTPERESPRRKCEESSLRDVPQPDNGRAAGGPEHHISKAEIDALQHVVEDGRIVGMSVYGRLRSLLVRLRPEWEGEGDSDRPKPINDERLAALEQLSALDQELELEYINARPCRAAKTDTTQPRNGTPAEGSVQAEGGVPDSRNAKEPVAWAVVGVGYEYVSLLRESAAEAARSGGGVMVPLYRQPQPTLTDAEREAVGWYAAYGKGNHADTLRGLLERLK